MVDPRPKISKRGPFSSLSSAHEEALIHAQECTIRNARSETSRGNKPCQTREGPIDPNEVLRDKQTAAHPHHTKIRRETMPRTWQTCVLALCVSASSSAFAATITAYGIDHIAEAPPPHDLTPTFSATSVRWSWSPNLVGAASALGITPSGNPQPTITLDRGRPTAVLQDFSLVSLTMEHSAVDGSLNVISEQLRGDITLTGAGSALTQGTGSMTLSDLRIDHLGKQVFAKVNGSASTETAIFSFDAPAFVLAETAFTPILTCLPGRPHCMANLESLSAHPVLSNLQFTEQGRTLWDQSFQLTPLGKVTMDAVGGLGKMSVTAVPEASTWALMLIGLAGIGLARRRLSA
jgi:hypothetical protein